MGRTLCDPILYSPWDSPGQITAVGSISLLQGVFPTQGSNPGLPHCRRIPYQLSHKGNPRLLDWVAYPFSSRPSQLGIKLGSPALQADSLPMSMSFSSVQFSSSSGLTLCDLMDRSTPGLPVHHQLLEFTHTHVHWVGDAIQPSPPLLSPSPLAFNPSFSMSQV